MSRQTKLTSSQAQRAFATQHGSRALRIVRMLSDGYNTSSISRTTKTSIRSVAAFAANFTRGAYDSWLRQFGWTPKFSQEARTVVSRFESGQSTDQVMKATGMSRGSVAAYKANYTRGAYDSFIS